MYPYVLLGIWATLLIIIQEQRSFINLKKYIYYINIFLLIIFYGIRENIGYDYIQYKEFIENNIYIFYASNGEFLSVLLMEIASQLEDYKIYFFLVAIISIPLYLYSIKKYTDLENKWGWGVLIFLALPIGLIQTLSLSRQFTAIAIILFATKYIINRNFVKYFICIMIASMFHISSLLSIIYYFVSSKHFKYKYFIWIIFMFILMFLLKSYLIILFPSKAFYLNIASINEINGLSQILLYVFFAIIFIYIKKYIYKKDIYEIILKIYLWSSMLAIVFSLNTGILGIRLGMPGLTYIFILLPYVFEAFNTKQRFLIKCIIYFILLGIYIYNLSITTLNAYVPYQSFLF